MKTCAVQSVRLGGAAGAISSPRSLVRNRVAGLSLAGAAVATAMLAGSAMARSPGLPLLTLAAEGPMSGEMLAFAPAREERLPLTLSINSSGVDPLAGLSPLAMLLAVPNANAGDQPESVRVRPIGPGAGLIDSTLRLPSPGEFAARKSITTPLFNPERTIVLTEGTFSAMAEQVYAGSFENDDALAMRSRWSAGELSTSPTGRRFLGELGNGSTTLRLSRIPAGRSIVVEFEVLAIGAFEGNSARGGPESFTVRVKHGDEMIKTNFATVPGTRQAFPDRLGLGDFEAGTSAIEVNALGFDTLADAGGGSGGGGGGAGDAIYRVRFRFDAPKVEGDAAEGTSGGDDVLIEFAAQGLNGSAVWGLDNVTVSMTRNEPIGGAGGSWGMGPAGAGGEPIMFGGGGGGGSAGGGGGGGQTPPGDPADPTDDSDDDDDTPDVPAPGAVGVLVLGMMGLSRRRR